MRERKTETDYERACSISAGSAAAKRRTTLSEQFSRSRLPRRLRAWFTMRTLPGSCTDFINFRVLSLGFAGQLHRFLHVRETSYA